MRGQDPVSEHEHGADGSTAPAVPPPSFGHPDEISPDVPGEESSGYDWFARPDQPAGEASSPQDSPSAAQGSERPEPVASPDDQAPASADAPRRPPAAFGTPAFPAQGDAQQADSPRRTFREISEGDQYETIDFPAIDVTKPWVPPSGQGRPDSESAGPAEPPTAPYAPPTAPYAPPTTPHPVPVAAPSDAGRPEDSGRGGSAPEGSDRAGEPAAPATAERGAGPAHHHEPAAATVERDRPAEPATGVESAESAEDDRSEATAATATWPAARQDMADDAPADHPGGSPAEAAHTAEQAEPEPVRAPEGPDAAPRREEATRGPQDHVGEASASRAEPTSPLPRAESEWTTHPDEDAVPDDTDAASLDTAEARRPAEGEAAPYDRPLPVSDHEPDHEPEAAAEPEADGPEQASPATGEQGPTVPLKAPAALEEHSRPRIPAEPGDVPVWPPRLPGEAAAAPDAPAPTAWPPADSPAPAAPAGPAENDVADDHADAVSEVPTGADADGAPGSPGGLAPARPVARREMAVDLPPDRTDHRAAAFHAGAAAVPSPSGAAAVPSPSGTATQPMPSGAAQGQVLLAPGHPPQPSGLPVPVAPPATAPAKRSGGGKRILLGAGTGVVVVAIGAAAYLAYTGGPEDSAAPGGAAANTAAPAATAPAAEPSTTASASTGTSVNTGAPVDSEETDPGKLTLTGTFPDTRITLAGRSFKRVKVNVTDSCDQAAAGAFAEALKQRECRRVLRATYVDAKQRYAVTTGIAVLPSKEAALAVDRTKNLSGNLWFRGLNGDPGSGAERVAISGGYAAGMVWGRYIVFSYATYADGHTPSAKEQDLGPVSGAFRDHTAEVIGKRVKD
ncbi:hypothetical protein ACFY05_09900 [Microtetraspora fusca]|uniref:Uncharacterized protein n=1 Tax=Microtetraspora fusca TaxID=1997 RepID=A0ABW6V293_MICFU